MKKNIKKLCAMLLAACLVLSLAGCGDEVINNVPLTPLPNGDAASGPIVIDNGDIVNAQDVVTDTVAPSDYLRTIKIGTWYTHYYDSTHNDVFDNPNAQGNEQEKLQLDNVRAVEKKYNVRIEYVNLTWAGIMESISNSILAGTPDMDLYEADLQFGVPAVLNGYAIALEDILSEEHDVFNDQLVMKNLKIAGSDKSYLFTGAAIDLAAYPLGFNMDMIEEAGLENPQDLWDRGEWTWDVFREYLKKLTKDTDADGVTDVYGGAFWHTTLCNNLLMSNAASIAAGPKETLSDAKTIEVLDFMYNLYQIDKTVNPWNDDDWDINTYVYREGKAAFWNAAHWIEQDHLSSDLGFEIGMVPWPVGPHGNKDTNSQIMVAGNWNFIPIGTERPELVFAVFYDYSNWFQGDTSLRDDTEWAENMMETERNFKYLMYMGQTAPTFDLWQTVTGFNGSYAVVTSNPDNVRTAAQVVEEQATVVQDYLDKYMK
ncbi:MAG: extracellular solute-binding protein [Lachnospiraceae bacterium]|nr:extracellular solute-binding protein [Lachnospiraceae bacterium]